MLKGDILKEMTGIDVPGEGVPSKAIWNPSDSVSSSSSIETLSTSSSNNATAMEDVEDPAATTTLASSSPAAFEAALPTAEPTENERRLRIYGSEDGQDENGMSAMLTSSINTAHGSEHNGSNDAKASSKEERKNNKLFGTKLDQRNSFIDDMSHLSDKQLRIQLWDSFRLARVILGKPVKDKRKLSHKSILHAIRKVAEMKIQIIRMSEELDRYQQREKKRLRRKSKIPQPGKENKEGINQERKSLGEDSSSTSFVFSPSSSSTDGDSRTSIRDVASDNDSPSYATTKLRAQAIQILQEERDLAWSQIQEIDQQRQKKRRRFEDQDSLLESPPHSPAAGALFLSPSESDDDYSYTGESASDILFAFRGKRSPYRKQDLESILEPDTVTYGNEADEIRRVLQKVVDYERQAQGEAPEVTTGESSAVHQEVIALLTRLTQTAPTAAAKASPQKSEADAKSSPVAKEEAAKLPPKELQVETETTNVVVMVEDTNEEGSEEVLPSAEVPLKKDEAAAPMDVVNEVEDEDIAICRAQLSAAKVRESESIEAHKHLNLQKEILQEDIAVARKNTTPNREKVQLKRLNGYKKQLQFFLKQEEERAKQMESLDSELNDLATVCVKLEDREADFQAKHEKHMAAMKDFEIVTKRQTENFRSLMGSIDRGIKEQTSILFGEKDDDTKSLPSEGSGSFDADNDMSAQKIQRLEYLLTKQNMEVFRLKAKLKMKEGKTREGKARKSRIKW